MKQAQRRRALAALAVTWALVVPSIALAASPPGSAVVLVSGFDTATPFTTPAAACAGREGPTWQAPTGPAAALKQAGYRVFTAPVAREGGSPGPPCADAGPAPPASATIDSNDGDLDENGRALLGFLAFLHASYAINSVQLVGHSNGGIWSRAAITQLPASGAGVSVTSLMTLGSPLTGSFGADLAGFVADGRCQASNPAERAVCTAMLAAFDALLADLGPTTIREATSSYLTGWNPRQQIGCPVTVAAGTFVRVPVVGPAIPRYYTPSDGVVGEASALGRPSRSLELMPIPGPGIARILVAGTFPVVHSPVLDSLTTNTLTNYAPVAKSVVDAVGSAATAAPCATSATNAHGARAAAARSRTAARSRHVRLRLPLRYLRVADRHGRLDPPARGDVALLLPGAKLRCDARAVPTRSLMGSRALRYAFPRCGHRPLARGPVLLLRPDAAGRALHIDRVRRRMRLRLTGAPLRRVRVSARVGAHWRRVALGRTRLPARAGAVIVRLTGFDRHGERYGVTAYLA